MKKKKVFEGKITLVEFGIIPLPYETSRMMTTKQIKDYYKKQQKSDMRYSKIIIESIISKNKFDDTIMELAGEKVKVTIKVIK